MQRFFLDLNSTRQLDPADPDAGGQWGAEYFTGEGSLCITRLTKVKPDRSGRQFHTGLPGDRSLAQRGIDRQHFDGSA
jgi:hypothetical protein